MKHTKGSERTDFPYARELITDTNGKVSKVVLDVAAYEALVSAVEDAGLLRAMLRTKKEKALKTDEALAYLES